MRDTIDMARESHLDVYGIGKDHVKFVDTLKVFEAVVRADEREQERKKWMQIFTDPENQPSQFGTVTVEFMQSEIKAEREACAVVAETPISGEQDDITMQAKDRVAAAIRARGQT
jgi:hypothetical protein